MNADPTPHTDPTTAAVRAAQAEALREAAKAAVSDGDDCVPWSHDHDRATVAVWLDERADRLATDTAAPVAVEGVETVETLAEVRLTDTEHDAIITALLNPDDDCAHNLAPLFRAVRSILAARIVQARAGEGALRERVEALANEYDERSRDTESSERYPWGVAADDLRAALDPEATT